MLRINSTWAGTEQATRAINSLQARLQLHNFTGCTWEDCKTAQSSRHQQVSSPCLPVSSRWVCSAWRSVERSSQFTQPPPRLHTQTVVQTAPKQRLKVHFPCLFSKLTAQLQLLQPFCILGDWARFGSALGNGCKVSLKAWGIWAGSASLSQPCS